MNNLNRYSKFIAIIIVTFLIQMLLYVFMFENANYLVDQIDRVTGVLIISPLALLPALFFWKKEKIKTKYQLTNVRFYVVIAISWACLTIIGYVLSSSLLSSGILHGDNSSFIPGVEYIIIPIVCGLELIIIMILSFIQYLVRKAQCLVSKKEKLNQY